MGLFIASVTSGGTFESFFTPHIYRDPLFPQPLGNWWAAHIWLHKPTGPFWLAAILMHVVGVTPLALRLVRPLGTVVLKTTVAGEQTLALAPIVIDEVAVVGSRCGPFEPALRALAEGRVDVRPLVSEVRPLDDAVAALDAAARPGVLKVQLTMT